METDLDHPEALKRARQGPSIRAFALLLCAAACGRTAPLGDFPPDSSSPMPVNCGVCGRSCDAGACAGGRCDPVLLAATPEEFPTSMAVGGDWVYWTGWPLQGDGGDIERVQLSVGAVEVVAANQLFPTGLALDGSCGYWVNNPCADQLGRNCAGSVMSAGLAGGAATVLATGSQLEGALALDDTQVFWTSSTTVFGVEKDGGPPTALAPTNAAPTITVHGDSLFWADARSAIWRMTLPAGSPTLIISPPGGIGRIAVDSDSVYFTNRQNLSGVAKAPIDGGAWSPLTVSARAEFGLAIDSQCVYWLGALSDAGESEQSAFPYQADILACPLDGCGSDDERMVIFARDRWLPTDIAVDGNAVYWTEGGGIWRAAR